MSSEKKQYGFDEMNFAEFPLAVLGKRDPSVKTLEFNDSIKEKDGTRANRQLIITGSDKFGLPVATDEDVLLALIKLTAESNYESRKVYFSRYEVLKILGWKTNGKNLGRVEEALQRLSSVSLFFNGAWYLKASGCNVNRKIQIIDDYETLTRAEIGHRREAGDGNTSKGWFRWNEVVFESLKSGNIKKLDFDFYNSLSSGTSKRLFRFLDKRFKSDPEYKIDMDLQNFACEKIGLKAASQPELKRRLQGALQELEEKQYILPNPTRYYRSKNSWRIKIERFSTIRKPGRIAATELPQTPEKAVKKTDYTKLVTQEVLLMITKEVEEGPLSKLQTLVSEARFREAINQQIAERCKALVEQETADECA